MALMILAVIPVVASAAPLAPNDYIPISGKYVESAGYADALSTSSPDSAGSSRNNFV